MGQEEPGWPGVPVDRVVPEVIVAGGVIGVAAAELEGEMTMTEVWVMTVVVVL